MASNSPPIFCFLASRPLTMPRGVERMEMPMPPSTRGISVGADILAKAGLADALQAGDGRGAVMDLRGDLDLRKSASRVHFVIRDIAFLLQDAGDLSLDLGVRGIDFRVLRRGCIAQAGQEISDGIGKLAHGILGCWAAASAFFCCWQSGLVGEWHAQFGEQRLRLFIGPGGGDDGHVEADVALDLVEFHFGKDRSGR